MPIYEYECKKCKAHTEILQKINDKPLTKCRKCGGKLEKQWSPTSFQLKGSGWYATDYAAKKPEAKTDGKDEKKADGKEEKKADTHEDKKANASPDSTTPSSDKATSNDTAASKKTTAKPSRTAARSGSESGD